MAKEHLKTLEEAFAKLERLKELEKSIPIEYIQSIFDLSREIAEQPSGEIRSWSVKTGDLVEVLYESKGTRGSILTTGHVGLRFFQEEESYEEQAAPIREAKRLRQIEGAKKLLESSGYTVAKSEEEE